MTLNLPTTLTLLRIAMIPLFAALFLLPWRWSGPASACLFALAAITDWLDGYLARRLNQTSRFGAFLDPVADKLMVATALVLLVQSNPNVWLAIAAAIIIGREIAVSALREWMAELGDAGRVKVSSAGKVKTTVQMIALLFLLFREPVLGIPIQAIGLWLLAAAAVLTLWSMIHYLRAAWPAMRQ
jgi:CDP-diacylglycerol--glycerol-3-phosphate 3-phosphatidyltransferase